MIDGPGSGHYVEPTFPPWYPEEQQARVLLRYRERMGYTVAQMVWMTDYRPEEVERLLRLAETLPEAA